MRTLVMVIVVLAACSGGSPAPPAPPTPPEPPPTTVETDAAPADPINTTQCASPRPGPGYQCIEDCGGPVVRDGDPPPEWRWLSPDQVAARNRGGCPRCLPAEARIATPDGEVAVASLVVGARVLTVDTTGRRQEAVVLRIGSTPVRDAHVMKRVTLADGRVVTASPQHPIGDGRTFATVEIGASLDASTIVAVERVAFSGDRTWDILPSGPTGLYIADGVVLGSTLAGR